MWSDSSIDDVPSELSQVNFSTSFQLFGSLGEQQPQNYVTAGLVMQQLSDGNMLPPQPQFPYKAWSDANGNMLPPQPQFPYEAWSDSNGNMLPPQPQSPYEAWSDSNSSMLPPQPQYQYEAWSDANELN